MDIAKYEALTGTNVASSQVDKVVSQINRARRSLETVLGYTLDEDLVLSNEYTELGKASNDYAISCNYSVDLNNLVSADDVVYAYRLFDFNNKDHYLAIDPCSSVSAVKLVKDGVTYKTFTTAQYRAHAKQGFIKYLERVECWCTCSYICENHMQLAVDANWLWQDTESIPNDLLDLWVDMVEFYLDGSTNIKSETLGSHSYTKFENRPPYELEINKKIIAKYIGGNGIRSVPTI